MAAITDGIGPSFSSTGVSGRRDAGRPSSPSNRTDRGRPETSSGPEGAGRFTGLGQLYQDRGHVYAEAIKVRQLDKKLSRVADQAKDVKVKLDQVKLYPPYPIDEPRRAEAIREFNGLAAEVKKMVASGETPQLELAPLSPTATTAEAEQAAAAAGEVSDRFGAQRAALAGAVDASGAGSAEADATAIASGLSAQAGSGISRQVSDLLIQIA